MLIFSLHFTLAYFVLSQKVYTQLIYNVIYKLYGDKCLVQLIPSWQKLQT